MHSKNTKKMKIKHTKNTNDFVTMGPIFDQHATNNKQMATFLTKIQKN